MLDLRHIGHPDFLAPPQITSGCPYFRLARKILEEFGRNCQDRSYPEYVQLGEVSWGISDEQLFNGGNSLHVLYHLSKESKKGTVPRGLQAILTATCVRTHSSDEAYEELKNYFGENFLPKGCAFFMDLDAESPESLAQARPLLYEINHDSGAEFGRYEDSPDFEYLSLSRPPRPSRRFLSILTHDYVLSNFIIFF